METQKHVDNMLAEMLRIAKVRFGSTIKGFWLQRWQRLPRLPGRHQHRKVQR